MELNGFLAMVRKYPALGKQMLTYTASLDKITAQSVLENAEYSNISNEEKKTFFHAISEFKEQDLENLIQFVTGARDLSLLGRTKIQVEVSNQAGVFASSCTFKLVLPKIAFQSVDALYQVLLSASIQSQSFNAL